MRIGVIAPPWLPVPPPAYGGIEAVVDRLARGLAADGHDVLLAASGESTCPVPRLPDMPSGAIDAGLTDHTVAELCHVRTAYTAMADLDLVHDHTVAGPLYRNRPTGLPIVTTNHGTFLYGLGELYREAGPDVTIVAISHHQAATARGVQIARVIHHGIDVDVVPCGPGDGGYACFLGRMSPYKGVREAVLVARRAGVPLLIAAKMRMREEREFFDERIAPLLGGDVQYVGEIGDAVKYDLLGRAVALLNPIQWPEPFGLVMIEALATGTPVVTTPSGAAPEIVDDGTTGYLRTDLDALAEALGAAAALDRAACRATAVARFSTTRMVAEHVDLYRALLDARPRRIIRRFDRRVGKPPADGTRDAG
ncbi:MAG TPA: glycosyltransferase [Mycobacteriales bacterium]|jgi:glycosyltransferase involved in cell wall biosynthesis